MKRAVIALSLLLATTAHADGGEPTSSDDGETYPLRIVVADVSSVAVFGLGSLFLLAAGLGGSDTETHGAVLITASVVGYTASAPLLHLHRGNPRGAIRSAVARAGMPLVGATFAYLSNRNAEDRPIYGAVAGMGVAMILDWTVLARMPANTAPFVAPAHGGGVNAGIAGQF